MYSELSISECINLAIEFVGKGLPIPHDLKSIIGSELIHEIENPLNIKDEELS